VVRSPLSLADDDGDVIDAPTPRSSLVTPTVLSVLALGLGLALALRAAGLIEPSVFDLAAVGLLVVGAGLVASLWLGRAPGLIPTGLLLSIVLVGASVTAPWFDHLREGGFGHLREGRFGHSRDGDHRGMTIGEYEHAPRSSSELVPHYALAIGELRLDLRQLDLAGETREVSLHVGLGELEVILPPDLSVEVKGHVGIGEANALGADGRSVQLEDLRAGPDKLVVNFHVGVGEVKVRREL
jgi:hypothetical protein